MSYPKPKFTEEQVIRFESIIDRKITKGNDQITLSTGIVSDEIAAFQSYLGFHYPSGVFSPNPNYRNYRIAKKGKKYQKRENW